MDISVVGCRWRVFLYILGRVGVFLFRACASVCYFVSSHCLSCAGLNVCGKKAWDAWVFPWCFVWLENVFFLHLFLLKRVALMKNEAKNASFSKKKWKMFCS